MDDRQSLNVMRGTSAVALLAGIYLIVSPSWTTSSYSSNAAMNTWILGIIVAVLASMPLAGLAPAGGAGWVVALAGIYLILSPSIVSFSWTSDVGYTSWILGIIVGVLGCAMGLVRTRNDAFVRHTPPPPTVKL